MADKGKRFRVWKRYLFWVDSSNNGRYIELLKRCLYEFENNEEMKVSKDYLDLWISYSLKSTEIVPIKLFSQLYRKGIGTKFSVFYLIWAAHCIKSKRLDDALQVIREGIRIKATPLESLTSKLHELSSIDLKQQPCYFTEKMYCDEIFICTEENPNPPSFEEKRAEYPKYQFIPTPSPDKTQEILNKTSSDSSDNDFQAELNDRSLDQDVEDETNSSDETSNAKNVEDDDENVTEREKADQNLERLQRMLEDVDTLSMPTKTISFNPSSENRSIRTPLPKKLFVKQRIEIEKENESNTFRFNRDQFLKSVKIDKAKRSINNLNNIWDPFDEKIRKEFVRKLKLKHKIEIVPSSFDFFDENKISEPSFKFFRFLKTGRNEYFSVEQIVKCSSEYFDFVVYAMNKDNCNNTRHVLHLSQKKSGLKHEALVSSLLDEKLSYNERKLFLLPCKFLNYKNDTLSNLEYVIPPKCMFLKELINESPLNEILVIYLSYCLFNTVKILHENDVIHGNINDKTVLIHDLHSLPDKKINQEEDWKSWCEENGVILTLYRSCFSIESLKKKGFIVDKNNCEDLTVLNSQPMRLRNKKKWTFEIDEIAICIIINKLLNGNELKIKHEKGSYYKPTNNFKQNLDQDLWTTVFFYLLNAKEGECNCKVVCRKLGAALSRSSGTCQKLVQETAILFSKFD